MAPGSPRPTDRPTERGGPAGTKNYPGTGAGLRWHSCRGTVDYTFEGAVVAHPAARRRQAAPTSGEEHPERERNDRPAPPALPDCHRLRAQGQADAGGGPDGTPLYARGVNN